MPNIEIKWRLKSTKSEAIARTMTTIYWYQAG